MVAAAPKVFLYSLIGPFPEAGASKSRASETVRRRHEAASGKVGFGLLKDPAAAARLEQNKLRDRGRLQNPRHARDLPQHEGDGETNRYDDERRQAEFRQCAKTNFL